MQRFSFARFATLLIRVLEITVVTALLSRWLFVFIDIRYDVTPAGTALDVAGTLAFLAIVLLLVCDLWLLLTHRPHAVATTVRTFVYLAALVIGPYRLGGRSPAEAALMPNQPMELVCWHGTSRGAEEGGARAAAQFLVVTPLAADLN